MSTQEVQEVNRREMNPHWFSSPQETQKEAEALHQPQPLSFRPAAVYETPDGKYVMGRLRPTAKEWPPHKAAQRIKELLGFVMVSTCDPLMGIWKDYQGLEQVV